MRSPDATFNSLILSMENDVGIQSERRLFPYSIIIFIVP